MTSQLSPFELQLIAAFDGYADEAQSEVDAVTLTALVADAKLRRHIPRRLWRRRPSWLVPALLSALLVAALAAASIVGATLLKQKPPYRGNFVIQPSMSGPRDRPILVALRDGRVLIAGGEQITTDDLSAEIFDPATGLYQAIEGDAPIGRGSALQLRDGRVLVSAYSSFTNGKPFLIDPDQATSRLAMSGLQAIDYAGIAPPRLVQLKDGRVLVVATGDAHRAQLFDPTSGMFTETGSMSVPRYDPAVALLPDGRVLVAGGRTNYFPSDPGYGTDGLLSTAEIYDPATETFTVVEAMPSVRGQAWATSLADGRILIVQTGDDGSYGLEATTSEAIDVFDSSTATFTALSAQRWLGPPSMTATWDGRILLTGAEPTGSTEPSLARRSWAALYDPIDQALTELAPPPQMYPQGVLLGDGRILLAGGYRSDPDVSGTHPVSLVEIFQ